MEKRCGFLFLRETASLHRRARLGWAVTVRGNASRPVWSEASEPGDLARTHARPLGLGKITRGDNERGRNNARFPLEVSSARAEAGGRTAGVTPISPAPQTRDPIRGTVAGVCPGARAKGERGGAKSHSDSRLVREGADGRRRRRRERFPVGSACHATARCTAPSRTGGGRGWGRERERGSGFFF